MEVISLGGAFVLILAVLAGLFLFGMLQRRGYTGTKGV